VAQDLYFYHRDYATRPKYSKVHLFNFLGCLKMEHPQNLNLLQSKFFYQNNF